jgi:signal transduction histidine kinase
VRRILEEAVTNAHKHGDGRWIGLRATETDDHVKLVVENSVGGRTAPLGAAGSGMGIRGMKERVGLYGGRLTVTPGDAQWRIEALLPLGADLPAAPYKQALR